MACNDGLTKIWAASAGSTFTQSVEGPAGGGFTAVATIFERDSEPVVRELPLRLTLQRKTLVVTHVVIVTPDPIDLQIKSAIGNEEHCTTVSGKDTTVKNVEHTIRVS